MIAGGRRLGATLLSLLVPAIGSCGECGYEHEEELFSIVEDPGCLPRDQAQAFAYDSDQTVEELVSSSVRVPDRTICWYRYLREEAPPCLDDPAEVGTLSRAHFVALASRKEPRGGLDYLEQTAVDVVSCDADGALFGSLLRNTNGSLRETSTLAECPAPADVEGVPTGIELLELVGSDLYPALVGCTYLVEDRGSCRAGAPPGGLQ